MPFVFTPQLWKPPALTAVKVPAGGVAWPSTLSPPAGERCRSSLSRRCGSRPALTAVKVPAGGVAWPSALSPQQATRAVRPHAAGVGGARVHAPRHHAGRRGGDRGASVPGRRGGSGGRAGEAQGKEGGREGDRATERPSRRAGAAQARLTASRRQVRVRPCALSTLAPLPLPWGLPREPTTGAVGGQRPRRKHGASAGEDEREPVGQGAPAQWAPEPFWYPLARTSAHIDAHPRTSACAERRPSVPGGPPLHTREVAGSKPAAPIVARDQACGSTPPWRIPARGDRAVSARVAPRHPCTFPGAIRPDSERARSRRRRSQPRRSYRRPGGPPPLPRHRGSRSLSSACRRRRNSVSSEPSAL